MKKLLKNFRLWLLLNTRYRHLKIDIRIPKKLIGNTYGGFYLAYSLIKSQKPVVYSLGIGEDMSFDIGMINDYGASVFAYDPTPRSIRYVESKSKTEDFNFFPLAISTEEGQIIFRFPENEEFVSGSIESQSNINATKEIIVNSVKLPESMKANGHSSIEVLKLDIEGSEYGVLLDWLNRTGGNANQVLVEIHDRYFENGIEKSKELCSELRKHGYRLFAVSHSLEELSFVKEKLL